MLRTRSFQYSDEKRDVIQSNFRTSTTYNLTLNPVSQSHLQHRHSQTGPHEVVGVRRQRCPTYSHDTQPPTQQCPHLPEDEPVGGESEEVKGCLVHKKEKISHLQKHTSKKEKFKH